MKIEPKYLTLREMLEQYDWTVPEYQRVYSWSKRQFQELLADIEKAHGQRKVHFMATIVGQAPMGGTTRSARRKELVLVDGQQRLTSLVILLRAVLKNLPEQQSSDSVRNQLESLLLPRGGEGPPCLRTNHDPRHILKNYLQTGSSPPALARGRRGFIEDNTIATGTTVAEEWAKAHSSNLEEIAETIQNKLTFVLQVMDQGADVYRIFETLNSRGLEVGTLDKVRAHLMGVVHRNARGQSRAGATAEIQQVWKEIYDQCDQPRLDQDETVRFAARLFSDAAGAKVPGDREAIRIIHADCAKSISNALEWSRRLLTVAKAERQLMLEPHLAGIINIVQARLAAVAICIRFARPAERDQALAVWERVAFREFGLLKADARSFVGEFVKFAREVVNQRLSLRDVTEALLEIRKNDNRRNSVLIDAFVSRDLYTHQPRFVKYALYKYELSLRQRDSCDVQELRADWPSDPEDTIEHVRPRSSVKRSQWDDPFGINSIGNLVLLPGKTNSSLQATDPNGVERNSKADAYKASEMLHTIEVNEVILHNRHLWELGEGSSVARRAAKIAQALKRAYPDR